MDLEIDPMEVEEDAYNFDELIESELKKNDSKSFNPRIITTLSETRYENKGGTFSTGIDIFSKEEKQRVEERAKRFGLTDKQIFSRLEEYHDLYSSMGVTEENENTKNFRLNVLHMRGTAEMSTHDVFKYFEDYAPASIEWINDVSCNVVWMDSATAARALVGLSKKIIGLGNRTQTESSLKSNDNDDHDIQVDDEDKNDENNAMKDSNIINEKEVNVKDIKYPLPPGLWRKGIDCPKSKGIFMRFARRSDKKQPHAEKMSEYYKKYGNPNFGGVRGILTESRKRTYRQTTQNKKKVKGNLSDEDLKSVSKNPWGDLSQTWGVNDNVEEDFIQKYHVPDQSSSVKERLGLKSRSKETVPVSEESDSESTSDSEEEWCKRSKVLRMRMHADDEEEKMQKRLSKIRKQEISSASNDLRSRLGRTRREPVRDAIQIVVTNYQTLKADISEEEEGEILDSESEDQLETENNEQEQEENKEIEEAEEQEEEKVIEMEKEDEKEEGEEDSNDDSESSEKEVRGPKGSVIKVMRRKPRLASTVWTRLNHKSVKSEVKAVNNCQPPRRDLRETLRGDLRSRLGNQTRARGRSPLRIEVKNDKCTDDKSDTELL